MLAFLLTLAAASGGTYWYARKRNIAPQIAAKVSGLAAAGGALAYFLIVGFLSTLAMLWPLAIALPIAGGYFYLKGKKEDKALPPGSVD